MKGDRALDDVKPMLQRHIKEMRVEFKVYVPPQLRHQRGAAAQFVGRADVDDGAAAEMLRLEQLADEQIAVVHEGTELRDTGAQALGGARAAQDVGMRRIGQMLVKIIGPERPIALANDDQFVAAGDRLTQAAVDAGAVGPAAVRLPQSRRPRARAATYRRDCCC